MKRKITAVLLAALTACLAACGGDESQENNSSSASQQDADLSSSFQESDSPESESDSGSRYYAGASPSGETAAEDSKEQQIDLYHEISDFEIIYQEPELPTGCEITAMTMVMHHYGESVNKVTMATEYLPCVPYETWTGDDGQTHGPDLHNYFIGDPTGTGCTCGPGAICTAADAYLSDAGSSLYSVDISGSSPEDLYALVNEDIPVVVWVTIGMEDRRTPQDGWYTDDGTYVDWSSNDHGAVLIGYTDSTVTIADPIDGYEIFDKEQFESVYLSRGSQAVILQDETETYGTDSLQTETYGNLQTETYGNP